MQLNISVKPVKNRKDALEAIGPIAYWLSSSHAETLRRTVLAVDQNDKQAQERGTAEIMQSMECQMRLAQIEMWILNTANE